MSLSTGDQSFCDYVYKMTTEEIIRKTALLDGDIPNMKLMVLDIPNELQPQVQKIKGIHDTSFHTLVSHIAEVLNQKGKSVIVHTSLHRTFFLPLIGLVDAENLRSGHFVAVENDFYVVLETLPQMCDSGVTEIEVDDRPTEQCSYIGGLDKQIEDLYEAVILPSTHKEKFPNLAISPLKEELLCGPPGTGKTVLARGCTTETRSPFPKLAGSQLAQKVHRRWRKKSQVQTELATTIKPPRRNARRSTNARAAPLPWFQPRIGELDAIGSHHSIGTKLPDLEWGDDGEVQCEMHGLLSQLHGIGWSNDINVIAAINLVDILDAPSLRSGRRERKIEFLHPHYGSRVRIVQIRWHKMKHGKELNFEEPAR
ncbi:hypothetical protein HPB48_002133 [Haemaphysalis longicornis]|uniref:ATPase AAA-type core domain-containing protein n=1 Tax=Haemaphysalis longicornis TaxID=44386 RepID=A0A9J6FGV4_HAELO|nr:hypothetical protein HPB48_002133 [Haemaphysalis longicornis]